MAEPHIQGQVQTTHGGQKEAGHARKNDHRQHNRSRKTRRDHGHHGRIWSRKNKSTQHPEL